ncbi:glycosyltransferase [Arenibacter echinorum]|uniref:Glycosyltransferase involved in cell wall biosynthesis n=1 Tax=Arenibacter echinorum TaxID=440515 RepID=A0A327RKE9_9FLAO|nr:glycosyltransferase [Arenibacter echinorum]RAJ16054.1 glycosyltransferase involved in cell wall biosynthesis [Arenibacter echinorum]
MSQKINITFIIPSLRAGGAERVMSYIAQSLDKNKFNASLLVVGFEKDAVFEIKNIEIKFLNQSRVLHAFFPIANYLSKKKPQIVISAIGHLNTLMGIQALFFPKIKFVAREVNVMSILSNIEIPKKNFFKFLPKFSYDQLDKIICQSKDMAIDIRKKYNLQENELIIINNPISDKFQVKPDLPSNKFKQFITVASLNKRKGHLRILDVLANYPEPFEYTLIGDGIEMETIFSHAKKLGLLDKIKHIPFTKDVSKYLQESDVFLQGSYVEGFPNALLESCAVGTPVIAFKAPGGIDEIVEEDVNGYIAKDEADFLIKLNLIGEKHWDPAVVRDSVYKKYSKDIIIKKYQDLFIDLNRD